MSRELTELESEEGREEKEMGVSVCWRCVRGVWQEACAPRHACRSREDSEFIRGQSDVSSFLYAIEI